MTKPYKKPRKPGDMGYHRGALAALGALYAWDGVGVAYHETINVFKLAELLHVARREGQMKWSGLSAYLRSERKQEPYREGNEESASR